MEGNFNFRSLEERPLMSRLTFQGERQYLSLGSQAGGVEEDLLYRSALPSELNL